MITPRKTRIPYLDFLKFFAIASVLLGHSVEQTTGNDFWDNPIWSFIYTYHMPLFMLLCGYFFSSSLNLSFGELVKKKFVQLVIPSLSAFAIMYAFVMLIGYNPCPELMDFSWFGFFNAVWFLKCVFFCYLIGYIALKSLRSFGRQPWFPLSSSPSCPSAMWIISTSCCPCSGSATSVRKNKR